MIYSPLTSCHALFFFKDIRNLLPSAINNWKHLGNGRTEMKFDLLTMFEF